MATITGGAIAGYVALTTCLLLALLIVLIGASQPHKGLWFAGAVVWILLSIGCWWWGMAFTTSADYHAWNVKDGEVDRVAKRLIATDKGMAERYVVTINGEPYGIDDTRAALVQQGDSVSLRCKKDFQWGVPREAHGWACRWNKVPGFEENQ
jgi:hypothetical protein